jgi:hypothetical protein
MQPSRVHCAAAATVVGAELLVMNVRHFPMISGLWPAHGA